MHIEERLTNIEEKIDKLLTTALVIQRKIITQEVPAPQAPTKFLTPKQVCQRLGMSERTLRRMIHNGDFPPPTKRNRRWARWPETDITAYEARLLQDRDRTI